MDKNLISIANSLALSLSKPGQTMNEGAFRTQVESLVMSLDIPDKDKDTVIELVIEAARSAR